MDTCEEEPFFDDYDERFVEILFAEEVSVEYVCLSMKKLMNYERFYPLVSSELVRFFVDLTYLENLD